jgi:hypothetical protein
MKAGRLFVLVALAASLVFVISSSAAASSGAIGVHSIAACKDSTTVAVIGSSTYANNRVHTAAYYQNADGNDVLLAEDYTPAFGAGRISLAALLKYVKTPVGAGTVLRIDVQLQRLNGNSYVNVGGIVRQYTTVADKSCVGLCSVTVDTTDAAPTDGTITLRSHYGSWFRPEGRMYSAVPISAGRRARVTFVGLPCGWTVRSWYYPKAGDTTPRMLPAQYWPNEYAATDADGTNPYTTSFAAGLPATHPLEEDDPLAVR